MRPVDQRVAPAIRAFEGQTEQGSDKTGKSAGQNGQECQGPQTAELVLCCRAGEDGIIVWHVEILS